MREAVSSRFVGDTKSSGRTEKRTSALLADIIGARFTGAMAELVM